MEGSLDHPAVSSSSSTNDHDGSSSSIRQPVVRQATIQNNGSICRNHQPPNKIGSLCNFTSKTATRHPRLVCFIDEELGHSLVTSTAFRPVTTAEEKPLLYYNSKDYAFLALEDHYRQQVKVEEPFWNSCQTKTTFGWEDCMGTSCIHEDDDDDELTICIDETKSKMHKVKTLHDLQS